MPITLATALILLMVHYGAIRLGVLPEAKAETQEMENAIRAETYVYEGVREPAVLVGTSLSAHIESESIYNMSFLGGSVQSGLAVLAGSDRRPGVALVEVNFIEKLPEEELAQIPGSWTMENLPVFQRRYQPTGVALGLIKRIAAGAGKFDGSVPTGRDERIFRLKLDRRKKGFEKPLDPELAREMANLLAQRVREIEKKGTRVVLYESPLEPELAEMPRPQSLRAALHEALPEKAVLRIEVDSLMTTDGIHLVKSSLDQMAAQLVEIVLTTP